MKTKPYKVLFVLLSIPMFTFLFAQEKPTLKKALFWGVSNDPFIPGTSIAGKGTADVRELFEIVLDEFEKLYGYEVTAKFFPAPKFLFKAYQDKKVDVGVMRLHEYLYAKNHGLPVVPLYSGKFTSCIYVHKDSKIKHVKDLKGKRFVDAFPQFMSKKDPLPPEESYIYWITIKKILLKHGIKAKFKDLFKEFRVLPVPNESIVYSVLLKKFDAFQSDSVLIQNLTNYDPGFSNLMKVSCLGTQTLAPFVYGKGLSPDVINAFKDYLLSPPKGSRLEKILIKEFKNVPMRAVPVHERDFDIYFAWLKEAKQKGWIDEFNEIMKNTPKPKTKGKASE